MNTVLLRRAVGADHEPFIAIHACGEIRHDLRTGDRSGPRDLVFRQLVAEKVAAAHVDGVEHAKTIDDAVGRYPIRFFGPHAPHQIADFHATGLGQGRRSARSERARRHGCAGRWPPPAPHSAHRRVAGRCGTRENPHRLRVERTEKRRPSLRPTTSPTERLLGRRARS